MSLYHYPHEALFMHKAHGFTYETEEGRPIYPEQYPQHEGKHYLTPASRECLEPRHGDLGIWYSNTMIAIQCETELVEQKEGPPEQKLYWKRLGEKGDKAVSPVSVVKIFQRYGRPFLWPHMEVGV